MSIISKNMLRYSLCLLLVSILMVLTVIPAFAAIKMTPYLQKVATNSIYVLVECDSTATVTVKYGLTTAYGSTAATETTEATNGGSSWIHNVKLTGLAANTLYHYQAVQGTSTSADATFYTAVNAGTGFRFAMTGDPRSNPTVHGAISSRIQSANSRFVLYAGDITWDYTYSSWKNQFLVTNALNLWKSAPFYNGTGNHEGWQTNTYAFTHGNGTNQWYSFDYGDTHVLVLSTCPDSDYSVGSAQYNFALSDLQASTKPWKIVMFHYPAYCYGGAAGPNAVMQSYANNIFVPNGVAICVTGHNHYYERITMNGIKHLVVGGGGAELHSTGTGTGLEKAESAYSYAIVDETATVLNFTAYRSDGTTLDSFSLTKGPQPTPTATKTPTPTTTPTQTPSTQLAYTFTSNAEGWTSGTSGKQYDAAVWSGTVGNPAGALKMDGSDLGTPDTSPNAWFYKAIMLPSNTANLTFDVKGNDSLTDANVRVRLVDAGNVSHTLLDWTTIGGASWQAKSLIISAYAGQTAKIYFEQNDSGQGSGEFILIDNVNITTSATTPTATKTPTPTTNSTPTPTATPSFSRVYEAEGTGLSHNTGRMEADGWSCNVTQDAAGHMIFGPNATDIPTGARMAKFKIMVDVNTGNNDKVLNLDVYDGTAAVVLAEKAVYRFDFTANNTYQDFNLSFNNATAGHKLEFRVWWYDLAYNKVDKITIN